MAIIAVGASLAIAQYLAARTLWKDEAFLAMNIVRRSPAELLQPLDYLQSAPPGFLLAEKLFSSTIPSCELGLRILPLGCFLVALVLFARLCRLLVPSTGAALAVLSLFAFSPGLLYYASEVKPYGCDAMFACLLAWLCLNPSSPEPRRMRNLAIAGTAAVFFSNAASLVLPGLGLWLLLAADSPRRRRDVIALGALWLVAIGLYAVLFLGNSNRAAILAGGGIGKQGFLNLSDGPAGWAGTILQQFASLLFLLWRDTPMAAVAGTGLAVGVTWLLLGRRRALAIPLLTPLATHLVAMVLKVYPLMPRHLLYATPLLLLAAAAPWEAPSPRRQTSRLRAAASLIVPVLALTMLLGGFPIWRHDLRPCFRYIASHWRPGDQIAFEDSAEMPALFYDSTGALPPLIAQGLVRSADGSPVILPCCLHGRDCHRCDDVLAGRIWILSSYGHGLEHVPETPWNHATLRVYSRHADPLRRAYLRWANDYAVHLQKMHGGNLLLDFTSRGSEVRLLDFSPDPARH